MGKNLSSKFPLRYIIRLGSIVLYNDQFIDILIDVDQTFCARKVHFIVRVSNKKFYDRIVVVAELILPYKPEEIKTFTDALKANDIKSIPTGEIKRGKKVTIDIDKKWNEFSPADAKNIKKRYARFFKIK